RRGRGREGRRRGGVGVPRPREDREAAGHRARALERLRPGAREGAGRAQGRDGVPGRAGRGCRGDQQRPAGPGRHEGCFAESRDRRIPARYCQEGGFDCDGCSRVVCAGPAEQHRADAGAGRREGGCQRREGPRRAAVERG
ncbi:unnamed protein product, partial [Prorocentrum cordatum]